MTIERFESILQIGETVAVEFKRCGGNVESDVYETVCSFSNRFGGDIFLGVLDDGTVEGVSEKAAPQLIKNFTSILANPALFNPTICIDAEIMHYKGKCVIHIYVPVSGEVISFKRVIYNRVNDSDVKMSSTEGIAQMYIRKQEIFTERKVFPYLKKEDLNLDLIPKVRLLAVNNAGGSHPWQGMTDDELLRSARLFIEDPMTGQSGFNLAAALLLGRDEVVLNVCPYYGTDALLRKVNVDRFDDRELVQNNLVESYARLFDFAKKHLDDKFYVEGAERKSLRNIIVREMVSNTLMHREFSSGFQAKFVIEENGMYVENANRARRDGIITPDNLEPYPKNPIIASFFRNIGFADQLGSGVRKMFKYTRLYSGKDPIYSEGDIFKITVPLDANYTFADDSALELTEDTEVAAENVSGAEYGTTLQTSAEDQDAREITTEAPAVKVTENQLKILAAIRSNPSITQTELAEVVGIARTHINKNMKKLQDLQLISRVGSDKNGYWDVLAPVIAPENQAQNSEAGSL